AQGQPTRTDHGRGAAAAGAAAHRAHAGAQLVPRARWGRCTRSRRSGGSLRRLLVLASFLATLGWSLPSVAHELLIDQVSLWREHDAARLRGQVSFDPELTRDLSRPPPRAEAE